MLSQITVKLTKNWLKVKKTDCSRLFTVSLLTLAKERASEHARAENRVRERSERARRKERREVVINGFLISTPTRQLCKTVFENF